MMGRGWSLQMPHQFRKVLQWPGELHMAWEPQLFSLMVVYPKYSEQPLHPL